MLKADFLQGAISALFLLLSVLGAGFGIIQNRKYKKEREAKSSALMEKAHELAKSKTDSKSIDELVSDRPGLLGGSKGNKSEDK